MQLIISPSLLICNLFLFVNRLSPEESLKRGSVVGKFNITDKDESIGNIFFDIFSGNEAGEHGILILAEHSSFRRSKHKGTRFLLNAFLFCIFLDLLLFVGYLELNNETGSLLLIKSLDREVTATFSLKIRIYRLSTKLRLERNGKKISGKPFCICRFHDCSYGVDNMQRCWAIFNELFNDVFLFFSW